MPIAYFHSHEYFSHKSIWEVRNLLFSKNWDKVSWQPFIDMCGEEPVAPLQNWKKTDFTLVYIQLLLSGGIMGEQKRI